MPAISIPNGNRHELASLANIAISAPAGFWQKIAMSLPRTFKRAAAALIPLTGALCGEALAQSSYRVNGVNLGSSIFDAPFYEKLRCAPSSHFVPFRWCTGLIGDRNQPLSITASVLHAPDGKIAYLSRLIDPAPFGPAELDTEIERLTKVYKEPPRVMRQRNSVIVTWGTVELEPLDRLSTQRIAAGQPSEEKGFLIDLLGNFRASAAQGLPIYRLDGGAGAAMVVNFDRGGTLRLTATNPSFYLNAPSHEPPSALAGAEAIRQDMGPTEEGIAPVGAAPDRQTPRQDRLLLGSSPQQVPQPDGTPTVRTTPSLPSLPQTAAGRLVQTVIAQGVGSDVESASRNAAQNALKQVVGSFIDTNTQIQRRSEIDRGIRSQTSSVQSTVREYSQGAIQAFDVLDVSKDDAFVRVEAKVAVRVEDFKVYIEKVAVGEKPIGVDLPTQIDHARTQQLTLEEILFNKVQRPVLEGHVQDIRIGQLQPFNPPPDAQILIGDKNPASLIAIPVTVTLKPEFHQNVLQTFSSTASSKRSTNDLFGFIVRCQAGGRTTQDYTVGIVKDQRMFKHSKRVDDPIVFFDVYGFANVRAPKPVYSGYRDPTPDFRVSFLDESGESLKDFAISAPQGRDHFIFPFPVTQKPWSLINIPRHLTGNGCFTLALRSEFTLVVEVDADTLRSAKKVVAKFEQ